MQHAMRHVGTALRHSILSNTKPFLAAHTCKGRTTAVAWVDGSIDLDAQQPCSRAVTHEGQP